MGTAAVFVGGMAAGVALLYIGTVAYFTADWWFPRRWRRRKPIEDVNLPEHDEWGPTR